MLQVTLFKMEMDTEIKSHDYPAIPISNTNSTKTNFNPRMDYGPTYFDGASDISYNDPVEELWARCYSKALEGGLNTSLGDDYELNFSCSIDQLDIKSAEFDAMKQPLFAIIAIISYIVVIFLGAIGNTMVVMTVIKTRPMWNATNLFIANLALADIFVCIFDLPFSIYSQFTEVWVFGAVLCKLIPMMFGMVVYSSTLSLTMIAIDRYILVVHPLATRMSIKVAMVLIIVIAIMSAAVASPIAVYSKYGEKHPVFKIYKPWCYEVWPYHNRRLYTILTLLLQYFIPLVIIGVLYTFIFIRIRRRISVSRQNSRKNKTTKMLVAVVTVFAVCWTPFHIQSILSDFMINPFGKYYKFADAMLRVFAMSSSCINPILYGWLNDNYRNAFLSIIKKPTKTPKNIHREDSERTAAKSNNTLNSNASPHKPLLKNSPQNVSKSQTLTVPEHIAIRHLQSNSESVNGTSLETLDKQQPRESVVQLNGSGNHIQVVLDQ